MPLLSIVIVSFNARADLEVCLASLHDRPPATPHEIIVVDNRSTDGSAEAAARWPGVRVIRSEANLGFARATNVGIRTAGGDLLLLLNPDTVMPPGAVDGLVNALSIGDDIAVAGPRLVDGHGRPELSFGRM